MFTERDIETLRTAIRPYYTEKRYFHALGVEEEATYLGTLLLPDRVNELRVAALLHDITKKYDSEKQLQCCSDFGIILQEPYSLEVLHALTGEAVARADFPHIVNKEILSAIRYHTTGHPTMTIFASVIFLADYIEPGRTHPQCTDLRSRLHAALEQNVSAEEKEASLKEAVCKALDNTITYLVEKQAIIDTDTISARNFFLGEKAMRKA